MHVSEQDRGDTSRRERVPPTAPWRIRLFGTLEVEHEGRRIARFRSKNIAALLAYLALHLRRQHSRDELADLFWPEVDMDAARNNFRVALASLRHQLEPPDALPGSVLITSGRAAVQLNPDLVCTDVAEFEDHLGRAAAARSRGDDQEQTRRLEASLGAYAGPFLPGFWLDWAVQERDRLGGLHVEALRRLAALREGAGDLPAALDLARRAGLADPRDLFAHADVMRLLAAAGRGGEALRQYDTITRVADREGEEVPALARTLAEDLRRRGHRPSQPPVAASGIRPAPTDTDGANPGTPFAGETRGHLPRLPVPISPFFGREAETAHLLALLEDRARTRLITLTGPGGWGKTRLALSVARSWGEAHGAGDEATATSPFCVLIPLTDVNDPDALPSAVAGALRLDRQPDRTPTEQIVEVLTRRAPSLLILDNFETLLGDAKDDGPGAGGHPEAALWVVSLLQSVPSLACLVTSRRRLLVDGEQDAPVPPLPVPPLPVPSTLTSVSPASGGTIPMGASDLEGLLRVPSVSLFVDRAQRVRPDFQITARNAGAVAELCVRLEGIPLAIEIAAAWANVLSVQALLARLETAGRFSLLTCRRRDLTPRHRTLRAAMETSVRALPAGVQAFFARVSVFRGGWTAEDAAAVCGVPLPWAEDAIARLYEHSLVYPTAAADATIRLTLLETLREFGIEHLEETLGAGAAAVLRERHARHFLALAEDVMPHLDGPAPAAWLDRLEAEQANFAASLAWAEESDDDLGLRLAGALGRFWHLRGSPAEGSLWLETFLIRRGTDADVRAARARALLAAALLPTAQKGDKRLTGYAAESLRLYRELGDKRGVAQALRAYAFHLMCAHDFGEVPENHYAVVRGFIEESRALCRETGDEAGSADCLCLLAGVASAANDEEARPLMERALFEWRRLGYEGRVAETLNHLGCWTLWAGDIERGEEMLEEALALCRRLGDHTGTAHALWALGAAALDRGDLTPAAERLEASIALQCARGGDPLNARADLARVRLAQEDWEGAKALLLEILPLAPEEARHVRNTLLRLARVAAADRPGRAARPDLAVRLCGAASAWHEAFIRRRIESGSLPADNAIEMPERPFLDGARAALGADGFLTAWEAGRALSFEHLVALAQDA